MADEVVRFTHTRFGELETTQDKIISFPDGLPGFECFKEYALFEDPASEPFQWFLSIESQELGFVVINPLYLWPDYDPKISKDDLKSLEISKPEEILIYSIVTLSDDPSHVTVNLSGPILINTTNRRARQLALLDDRYTTKHKILDAQKV
ncbi:TPA: flagellar assembly protein FliW [Candidatus Latescibacteria bacterium]|nr:flagellar assembly protein FliW [Candidatus Latescibacterota bacterium]|tara:strand:- start:611 stop:1060 length:450 start_codon:yes stop_codon:yes gene_type:complete